MRYFKLVILITATIAVSPLLLLWRCLDYCSFGWFTTLAKQYLVED